MGGKSHGGFIASFLGRFTRIPRISRIFLWVGNLTEVGGKGVWGCPSALSVPSALSAKAHTDSTDSTKIIRGIRVIRGLILWGEG